MFGRHLKKEYRRMMCRVYAADSEEPIGERYTSLHDPVLQVVGASMVVSFAAILLFNNMLPFFDLCEPLKTGSMIPHMTGVLGALWGYYGVSEPDSEE